MMEGLKTEKTLEVTHGINDRFFGIIRTALKQKPDYIHFDWIESYYTRRYLWMTILNIPVFLLQIIFCRIMNIKLVHTMHNLFPHDSEIHSIHRFVQKIFLKQLTWIRVFSYETIQKASQLFKIPEQKFSAVPEGSYITYYPNTTEKYQAKKKLQLPAEKTVVLFFGTLRRYKGIKELIQVFKQLRKQNTILLIAGRGIDRTYLKELHQEADDTIRIDDTFIEKENVQFYFAAADLVVLPFLEIENSGSAILAMGFSKAIVAPQSGVLQHRLQMQAQLLYAEGCLQQKLAEALSYNTQQMEDIGKKNYLQLAKHKWVDFCNLFKVTV